MDFSTRIVKYAYDVTEERRDKILDQVTWFIKMFRGTKIVGWDDKHDKEGYVCDAVNESFEEYCQPTENDPRAGKFYNQIKAAIRAGLDVALPDRAGGGVVGFTVGDLRKMYTRGIPQWVCDFFEPPLPVDAKNEEPVWL